MADFNKIKEMLKGKSREEQQALILEMAKNDPSIKEVAQDIKKANNFKSRGTATYEESLLNPNKGLKVTPIEDATKLHNLPIKQTRKEKLLESYNNYPINKVEKPKTLKPISPDDDYIKSKISIQDEATKLNKKSFSDAIDKARSIQATELGLGKKPEGIIQNLFSKTKGMISEGVQAGAKAGAKAAAKGGLKAIPIIGTVGAGLMSGADAYADTGSMKEALKAGGAEMANPTPIPTEIITGAIEDRDAIKKDLMLDKYKQEAEDKAKQDYINSPAKQAALGNYEDGGIPFSKMNPDQKETMTKLLNTYRGLIDSEDDADGMKLDFGRKGIKKNINTSDIPEIEKYSEKLKELDSMVDDSTDSVSKNIKANNSAVKEIRAPFDDTLKELELDKPVKKSDDVWDIFNKVVQKDQPVKKSHIDTIKKAVLNKKVLAQIGKKAASVLGPIAMLGSAGLEAKESLDSGEDIKTALEKAILSAIPIDTEVSHDALKNYKDYERHENEDKYINEAEDKAEKDYKKSPAYSAKFKNLKSRLLY